MLKKIKKFLMTLKKSNQTITKNKVTAILLAESIKRGDYDFK